MKIHIRYFASLREITGRSDETLEVPEEANILTVRTELLTHYPNLQPIMQRCIGAVNRQYVAVETTLHDGDELVFIPPMGGGKHRMIGHTGLFTPFTAPLLRSFNKE